MPTTLPIAEPKSETARQGKTAPRYHVILFDDDEHSYAYVVEMMMNLFAMTAKEGFDIAYEVDHIGQAIVKTCSHDEALQAHQKIINYGPDYRMPNSKGSMGCCIERAED